MADSTTPAVPVAPTSAFVDLWRSERAVICLLLIALSTALALFGKLSSDQWIAFAQWIAITYVAGKTMTGAIDRFANRTPPPTAHA